MYAVSQTCLICAQGEGSALDVDGASRLVCWAHQLLGLLSPQQLVHGNSWLLVGRGGVAFLHCLPALHSTCMRAVATPINPQNHTYNLNLLSPNFYMHVSGCDPHKTPKTTHTTSTC